MADARVTQGSGIGRETALAFATAEAKHLVLAGRTEATLRGTESLIAKADKNVTISIVVADVCNEEDVKKIANAIESWNVLVHNAGYMSAPSPAAQADVEDYWKSYEVRNPHRSSAETTGVKQGCLG